MKFSHVRPISIARYITILTVGQTWRQTWGWFCNFPPLLPNFHLPHPTYSPHYILKNGQHRFPYPNTQSTMATLIRSVNYSIALIISLLSLSSLPFSVPYPSSRSIGGVGSTDIHDILPVYNIPKGILPNAVKSYSFSSDDGSFSVEMENTCYVKFADGQLVYYDWIIKGKLSYGKISQVSGIQAKRFLWVPVTGLDVDSDSGMVEFHVGPFTQKLPAQQFETIPTCIKNKLESFWANYYFY